MKYSSRKQTRPGTTRRVRMADHDYTQPGYYFVTVCTYERQCLFGQIRNENLHLTPAGEMLQNLIPDCESKFSSVSVDSFIVMPNHLHVLIGLRIGVSDDSIHVNLSQVMKWLKNAVARRYGAGVHNNGWMPFQGRLWQKGFHDHIVRNERELDVLRAYIATNVESWEKDKFYDGFMDH